MSTTILRKDDNGEYPEIQCSSKGCSKMTTDYCLRWVNPTQARFQVFLERGWGGLKPICGQHVCSDCAPRRKVECNHDLLRPRLPSALNIIQGKICRPIASVAIDKEGDTATMAEEDSSNKDSATMTVENSNSINLTVMASEDGTANRDSDTMTEERATGYLKDSFTIAAEDGAMEKDSATVADKHATATSDTTPIAGECTTAKKRDSTTMAEESHDKHCTDTNRDGLHCETPINRMCDNLDNGGLPDALDSKQRHISDNELKHWKKDFDDYVTTHIQALGSNTSLITDEKFEEMLSILSEFDNPSEHLQLEMKQLKLEERALNVLGKDDKANDKKQEWRILNTKYQRQLRWKNTFEIQPGNEIIRKGYSSLDVAKHVSCPQRYFDDIWKCHYALGSHRSCNNTIEEVRKRYGSFINRDLVRRFYKGCVTCSVSLTSSKPPAGTKPIIAKSFLNRIQMDLVDMSAFTLGLHDTFQYLSKESQNKMGKFEEWCYVPKVPKEAVPSYICNIADHASKVGKSYGIANKRPESVAMCLLDFISTYGVPSIIHTDNGGEFINMCYDAKYKGVRFSHLSDEEFKRTKTILGPYLTNCIMLHGRARHSQTQGFIENRNKAIVNFLVKWCLANQTGYWWLGLPFATLHVNLRKNTGTKTSPFEFIFGHEGGARGVGELQIPKQILEKFVTESDLNLHFKLAEGQLFEWVGRSLPPIEDVDRYGEDCRPIQNGETIQMGQTTNTSRDGTTEMNAEAEEQIEDCETPVQENHYMKEINKKRKLVRDKAEVHECKKRNIIKKRVLMKSGGELAIGDVVTFPAHDSDKCRLSGSTIIAVVVERDNEKKLNTLGTRGGDLLKTRYQDGTIRKKNDVSLGSMGLQKVFDEFKKNGSKGFKRVSERAAIITENTSVSKASSLNRIICKCEKGNCKNCKCAKNNRKCTDRCHSGKINKLCINC